MDFSISTLLTAFAGGLFGAAIGGLPAFIFTGFIVLIGLAAALAGSPFDLVTDIAFGPVFGPHIAFGGGGAAAAYAARRGELEAGKDILTPLAGLSTPDVLLVGGAFGLGGHVIEQLIGLLQFGGEGLTDSIAITVVISGLIARLLFGRTGPFGTLTEEARSRGRFTPGGDNVWLAYQEGFGQTAVIGAGAGVLSAYLALTIAEAVPEAEGAAGAIGFGISAVSLLFLNFGFSVPVTHHMTLIAAVAATTFASVAGLTGGLIIGGVAGVIAALLGELGSRLFLIHGDTHVDPPAFAIFILTSVVTFVALAAGI